MLLKKIKIVLFIILLLCLFDPGIAQSYGPDSWEASQDKYQPSGKIISAMGIKAGMVIGEIGAGRGRFAVKLAAAVGKKGKIFANDILKDKLEYLKKRCRRDNISNIITIVGEYTDPMFRKKSLDIAFMVNTYHHIGDPVELLKNTIPSLKPDGRLIIIECDPVKEPSYVNHSTKKEKLIKQMEKAGYKLVHIKTFLPKDNIYFFKVKKSN